MKLLYSLFRQRPDSREGVIITVSGLGIAVNMLSAAVKIIIGFAVGSIAVVSEGLNNATDCASSLLTIVGTKLAGRHPTEKHPFGFGRTEYLTSLLIAGMILFAGFEAAVSSVKAIFNPTKPELSFLITAVIAVSAIIKLLLGTYTMHEGERIGSGSLVAIGKDCRSDCLVSVVTVLATLVYLIFDISLDAYAGVITSLFIIKAGAEVLRDTLSEVLGESGSAELANGLYRIIRSDPLVLNAADMMLHNYGPDSYTGSVNIEVDYRTTVEELYADLHALQLKIMHEHNITMVFGVYAVDADRNSLREMRAYIGKFVQAHEHISSYHALYIDPKNNDIYCDLVVDYQQRGWEELKNEFTGYMHEKYPDSRIEVVIETQFV